MEKLNFKQRIENVLKSDERLWNSDKTELNQALLLDLLENIDIKIIELLIQEDNLRNKFFVKIKDVYVFKTNDFRFFMEENKVDNNYTSYKNRIGLTDGKRFLKDTNDVVLNWPFKDCVLEGGQSTEEGLDTYFEYSEKSEIYEEKQAKRKEIFFNQVIAHDEIDRLFDPKAFVNWKRYTKEGEQDILEIKRDKNGIIKENMIIKGNNLLALHSLKQQFTGKIKLIYIDPPYNTGGSGDTFVYNNSFKRSSWLTFMRNRLEVAKRLLQDNGVLIAAIDDYEMHSLRFLLDEILGDENRLGTVVVVHNPRGRNDDKYFATMHEYLLVYAKNKDLVQLKNFEFTAEDLKQFNKEDDISTYSETPYTRTGNNSNKHERPNLFYSIYYDPKTSNLSLKPSANSVEILPINAEGDEKTWRWGKETFEQKKDTELLVKIVKGDYKVFKKRRPSDIGGRKPRTVWSDSRYDASSNGIMLLRSILGKNVFSYPKSLYAVMDFIKILSDKNDRILDFFAGSSTTAHAVLELNKEDGGNRKFIMIEQIDYINTVTSPRIQKVIKKENINDTFIYFEMAKWNETAKEKIIECENLNELIIYFDDMYERYFLNYNLKIKEFKEKVIKEEKFRELTLDEQKNIFVAMLDNNQMYVNKTEMSDKKFGISESDKKLTCEFYDCEV
ncbi:MAG: site-specific DNA-methyltransferase [Candidatus Kapabacteria bacterium]|nr:site-specific DNA-methyltransferase [Candidatus Kapabacteria bacterium]